MRRLLKWDPSLLTRFSLLGGLITLVIAAVLAWALQQQLEQSALAQQAASAADQVALFLGPNLTAADLSAPLDPARFAVIDGLVRKDILHEQIVRVKIYSTQGQLIYSDDRLLIGQTFPISDELKKALGGQIATDLSPLTKSENVAERALYTELLEVYVPIRLGGSTQVVGVYEIYQDLTALQPSIAGTRRVVLFSVGLGFLILYGSLFTVVRNASLQLVRRNEENKNLYEQEQTRRAELGAQYDLSRALADARDFETTLAIVTRHAVETVKVTFARVALIEGSDIVVRAAYPIRSTVRDLNVGERVALASNGIYQRIMAANTPTVITADSPDLQDRERQALFLGTAKSVCMVPLRAGERVLGFLMLGEARGKEREPFTAEKMRLAGSIADQAASALYRAELFTQLEQSYVETVLALANAVDAKDTYTGDHAKHVATMALEVAAEMGMPKDEMENLRYGSILHDIGKIGIPDAILKKPSSLDAAEWQVMREHPAIGARILAAVPRLAGAAEIVRHHHERYDGKGYPDGLAGEAIPLGARILTVVDSYTAIIDRRVYKEARSHEEAVAELRKHSGTQFDPHVVDVFLATKNAG